MKTHRSIRQPRAVDRTKGQAKPNCEQALRLCEEAAALVKSASDELADCWARLNLEMSSGVSATELLRRRAWCNVLELRLKERAHALEEARQSADAVWKAMMQSAQGGNSHRPPAMSEGFFAKSWSLLMRSMPAPRAAASAPLKRQTS